MTSGSKLESRFVVEPLTGKHDRLAFHCGAEPLDRYFREQAGQEARKRVAAPFVLVDGDDDRIAGYYTLSMTSLVTTALPTGNHQQAATL